MSAEPSVRLDNPPEHDLAALVQLLARLATAGVVFEATLTVGRTEASVRIGAPRRATPVSPRPAAASRTRPRRARTGGGLET